MKWERYQEGQTLRCRIVARSPEEYIRWLQSIPPWGGYRASRKETSAWNGAISWDEACRRGLEGDVALARSAEREASRVMIRSACERMERINWMPSVEGSVIDVAAYCTSEPECWLDPSVSYYRALSRRAVVVIVQCAASHRVDGDTVRNRGLLTASMVCALQAMGVPTELWVVHAVRASASTVGYFIEQLVRIQKMGEHVSLDKLAFWVAHPAVLRRLMFGGTEGLPKSIVGIVCNDGYGTPTAVKDFSPCNLTSGRAAKVMIDHMAPSYAPGSKEARAWLREKLEEQGITFKR